MGMGVMALFFAYYHEIGLDLITFLAASCVCGQLENSAMIQVHGRKFAIYNRQFYTHMHDNDMPQACGILFISDLVSFNFGIFHQFDLSGNSV